MRLLVSILLPISAACSLLPAADQAALVIGNGSYQSAMKLANPTNDADGVAQRLKAAGWEVQVVKDASGRDMRTALRTFCEAHAGAKAAMVFYAGHGVEDPATKKNYLLPVDAKLETQDDLAAEALCLDDVLDRMKQARIGLKTVVLDCCRDNPIPSRSWLKSRGGSGLAEVESEALPDGTLLVFSTAPGKTTPDGSGKNSPFTTAFLSALEAGGSMVEIFSNVSEQVTASEPWIRFDNAGRSLAAFARFGLARRNQGQPDVVNLRQKPQPLAIDGGSNPGTATKNKPFVNSLGMKFVPVGIAAGPSKGKRILFSVWETRSKDYAAFVIAKDRKYEFTGEDRDAWTCAKACEEVELSPQGLPNLSLIQMDDALRRSKKGQGSGTPIGRAKNEKAEDSNHPATYISWFDAAAFCNWLSQREGLKYRLPSDLEWSAAAGLKGEIGDDPELRHSSSGEHYPSGGFPGFGNYDQLVDNEGVLLGSYSGKDLFETTAPVGSFSPNDDGLFDMGGNVCEWCLDLRDSENSNYRVIRGGGFMTRVQNHMRTGFRGLNGIATEREGEHGFRCVIELK